MFRVSGKCLKVGSSGPGIYSVSRRYYQCEHGVYGYRPKIAEPFKRKPHPPAFIHSTSFKARSIQSAVLRIAAGLWFRVFVLKRKLHSICRVQSLDLWLNANYTTYHIGWGGEQWRSKEWTSEWNIRWQQQTSERKREERRGKKYNQNKESECEYECACVCVRLWAGVWANVRKMQRKALNRRI